MLRKNFCNMVAQFRNRATHVLVRSRWQMLYGAPKAAKARPMRPAAPAKADDGLVARPAVGSAPVPTHILSWSRVLLWGVLLYDLCTAAARRGPRIMRWRSPFAESQLQGPLPEMHSYSCAVSHANTIHPSICAATSAICASVMRNTTSAVPPMQPSFVRMWAQWPSW